MSILGVDVDGCLADFHSSYTDLIIGMTGEDRFKDRYGSGFPPVWDYPEAYGYSDAAVKDAWKRIKKDSQFWLKLAPLPGADETLAKLDALRLEGHEIYFVTARPGLMSKWQAETWLQTHGFEVPTVIMQADKAAVWELMKFDAYVDDKLDSTNDVMRAVREERAAARVYLKHAPYNDRPLADPEAEPLKLALGDARDPGLKVVKDVWGMLEEEGLL